MKTLILTLALVALSTCAHAQGTVQFENGPFSKIKLSLGPLNEIDAPVGTVVGLFWGESPSEVYNLSTPTVIVTTPGLFSGGTHAINGVSPGQQVYLVIGAWLNRSGTTPSTIDRRDVCAANITDYGETAVVAVTPGPSTGPGTVIWQPASGVFPDRMKPFTMVAVCPEPSVMALGFVGLAALLVRRRRA